MKCKFFNPNQEQLIENYLQENILSAMKNQVINFLPVTKERIETICNKWLNDIRNCGKNSSSFNCSVSCKVDEKALQLIQNIFCEKFGIIPVCRSIADPRVTNGISYLTLLEETEGEKKVYNLKMIWTPDNQHVYPIKNPIKTMNYTQSPEKKMNDLLADAKEGRNTDLTFQIGEQLFYAHSLILKERSIYFNSMLNSGCKEAVQENPIITLSDISPLAFEQFLQYAYMGSLADLCHAKDCLLLLELFKLAHLYQQDDLKNHVLELLESSFADLKKETENPVALLLNMAYLYESRELKNIAFTTLNKLNTLSAVAILAAQSPTIFNRLEEDAETLKNEKLTERLNIITTVRDIDSQS